MAGFEGLDWPEVADIVWLAAAMRSGTTESREHDSGGTELPDPVRPAPAEAVNDEPPAPVEPACREPRREPGDAPVAETPPPDVTGTPPPNRDEEARGELPPAAAGGPALTETLECFRALRPLKREIASFRYGATILDEVATAEQVARTGTWWPITRSSPERWLDLTVVLDDSPSMSLWRPKVVAFLEMLARLGAFRTIQFRLVDVVRNEDGTEVPVLRGGTPGAPARDPAEVLDVSGRRVMLLVTDGVGGIWRPGLLNPVLARWARSMPVSVLHLLPQWLWGRGAVPLHRANLSVPAAMRPNSRWTFDLPDAWLEEDPSAHLRDGAVPVPVIELQPRYLKWWARLITAGHRGPAAGTVLLATRETRVAPDGDMSAKEHVGRFRSLASPPALRLATLLAAVPAHPEVVKLIRHRFVPEAKTEHLSELLLSGVVHYSSHRGGGPTWDSTAFVFPEKVRELLLNGARRSETAGVVQTAAAVFGDRIPVLGRLRDAIVDPDNTPDPVPSVSNAAEVGLQRAVMGALSGPYLSRADRLSNAVAREVAPSSGSIKTRMASKEMPDAAERTSKSTLSESHAHSASDVAHFAGSRDLGLPEVSGMTVLPASSSRSFHERRSDDPPIIWGNVPPRNPNFTGRVELLEQLGKRLTAGGATAVLPSALHGMGGIGKTQMATEYIYRHLQDYDLIWWIEAARPTQIRAGLTELARQLGLPGASEANTAVPAVREALRVGRPFRRWLLVFDAAESPEEVRPYFPANGPGEVLITSRNPDWAGVARPLELAVFDRAESIELLGKRGPEIDQADANVLAEKLGDLPLAIEQAAAWRAVTGMPVSEYLRLFDESVAEILDTSAQTDYERSVAAAWNVSFDELKKRNPAAHQILHICAFFSPEPISRDLFTGVNRVSISPELDAALRDPIKLARAIRDINRYGLAKIDHANNTLQLHRLVQLVLRNRSMAPQVHAQMMHGAHQLLASLDPNDPESNRHWPRYRELLPHAYASDISDCDDDWPRQLIINLMRFLSAWGDHEEAARLAQRANESFERKLGPTHPQTLEVASRLGFYLRAAGSYEEGSRVNQRTLQRRISVSGEDSEEVLKLQLNIVVDLRVQGDFAAATKLSEEIYHKSKRLFGEDDPETLQAAYQHGISLRLSGEYLAAAELDRDTADRRSEVLGPDHPRTLSSYASEIVDRREAGEYVRSRIEMEKFTEVFRARFPADNPDQATFSFMLSVVRRKDGDHARALELSTPALAQFSLLYKADNATRMACALAHSIDLRHTGDLDAAKKLGEDTFEHYRNGFGESHPHTISATVDLAVTMRLKGEVAEARELNERALELFRGGLGPNHPYAIVTTVNLASDLAALGETERAIALGQDAVERGGRVLGVNHPTVLAASLNLGHDLRTAGRPEEAVPYHEPVLDRYRKVLGEAHPGTISAVKGVRANCDIDPLLM
ncbi:FxSxx-COOH system tetratricopeptide repeat protein [Lentzea flaviverrucosa]|uniref:NB-ARC domain-containing protein n=1 Tax=Lentzea flaviverrucosa TaxID=200379 RepID=A0A1H9XTB2_9PSEU|nr:FxSxx-COOH system tetratricopeptide repeat protein [Lentzea flaviverrucosa]RDI19202.1 NB-ARC domain-containing protein [Lentzea flaviverrucosa]SES49412.1 NB-ARC domain-containing protein [Lentzea flaviverrucosa]